MIGIGVIGYGYWGPNLVRNFADSPDASVRWVCDLRQSQLAQVERRYPGVNITTSPADVFHNPSVDAVVIATPVEHHFDLALSALRAGKHVLVEKPMTATSDQASRLIDEAAARTLVLMVGHTFVYTGAVQKMRELTETGQLGDIYYYDSVRINLGIFQRDVNVLWDLAVHDLSRGVRQAALELAIARGSAPQFLQKIAAEDKDEAMRLRAKQALAQISLQ